jgi:hypothetical protein
MNKTELLRSIANSVSQKHPWKISQEKYQAFFGELPREFLNERLVYDNLVEKSKGFKLCYFTLSQIKIEIQLNLDQCIEWELHLDKWKDDVNAHHIVAGDIKKLLKSQE